MNHQGNEGTDPGSDLDAGLEAAFGAPEERGASILKRIERLTGVKSQLILHDAPGEESPLTYVHRLSRDDEGAEDDSRYQIAGEIAKGGVGVVYKGRDRDLGRDVALKVLRKAHAGNPEVFHRFVEEAQIGGQLQHPGIVPVYSLGLQPDGRPSFAMKLVKGRTLAAALKERKSPADGRRSQLRNFERICQTMAYAHARGVIHRDLKPSNVMLGAFGEVLVVDWGFGKVLGRPEPEKPEVERTVVTTVRSDSEGSASIAGSVMGTPAYMPPEQALGHVEDLDEQTDVFALGAILTEILTGKPPYVGEAKDLLVMASQARLEDAQERLKTCDADPEVTTLAKRCLEPMRSDRPVNAGEVAEEVGRLLTQAEERAHAAEIDAVRERSRSKQAKNHAQWERRAKRLTIGLAAAILLAIVAGGGFFLSEDAKQRERTAKARPMLEQAVEEVSRLSGQGKWAEALAVAKKAGHLAADLDEGTREQARKLVRETDAGRIAAEVEAAQIEKDTKLLAELSEIRVRAYDLSQHQQYITIDRDFTEALRSYGLDTGSVDPEEAGAALRSRGEEFAREMAAIFDHWSWLRRTREPLAGSDSERIGRIAAACDPDPTQARLRRLGRAADYEGLARLAREESSELSARTSVMLGRLLEEGDRTEDQIALLERAARRYPGDFWIQVHLGQDLHEAGRSEESLRHFTAALAIRPRSPQSHNSLGAVLNNAFQDFAGAERYFRTAIGLASTNPEFHFNLGNVLLNQGKHDAAVEAYAEALRLEPTHARARTGLGNLRFAQGDHEGAIVQYREAIRCDPSIAMIHSRLGYALQRVGSMPKAIEAFREALRLNPENALDHNQLGLALKALGRFDEAADAYEDALRVDPEFAPAHCNRGQALWLAGSVEKAFEAYREAIRCDPACIEAHLNLARGLWQLGRRDEALTAHRRFVELQPEDALAHFCLGTALASAFRHEKAVPHLRRAIHLDTGLRFAQLQLGGCLMDLGRYAEALPVLRGAVELEYSSRELKYFPKKAQDYFLDVLSKCERFAKLAKRLPAILEEKDQPTDAEERAALGEVCIKTGRYALAHRFYTEAFAEDPALAHHREFRYCAGCAAAVCASNTGRSDADRAAWRGKAYELLRADLDWKRENLASTDLVRLVTHWLRDPDLAGVRDEAELAKLPEAERREWQALWKDVQQALAKARGED